MGTTKQNLSRFRNLGYGRVLALKLNLNSLLSNLPNDCKALTDDEKRLLLNARTDLNDLLAIWKHNSKKLINNCCNL